MYFVSVDYNYKYNAYEREHTMYLHRLYVVSADSQYEAMKKSERFIWNDSANAVITKMVTSDIETGRCSTFVDGFIL